MFEDREITNCGAWRYSDWQIKLYGVRKPGVPTAWDFADGIKLALERLPSPAVDELRPGLAFIIIHAGIGDYVVSCWWDNLNELRTEVVVRPSGHPNWRPRLDRESFCVWDLEILWAERNAFVQHILDPGIPDTGGYISGQIGTPFAIDAIGNAALNAGLRNQPVLIPQTIVHEETRGGEDS